MSRILHAFFDSESAGIWVQDGWVGRLASSPDASGGLSIGYWVYVSAQGTEDEALLSVVRENEALLVSREPDGTIFQKLASQAADVSTYTMADAGWYYIAYVITDSTQKVFIGADGESLTEVLSTTHDLSAAGAVLSFYLVPMVTDAMDATVYLARVWEGVLTHTEFEVEAGSLTPVVTTGLWADYRTQNDGTEATRLEDSSGNSRDLSGGNTFDWLGSLPTLVVPLTQFISPSSVASEEMFGTSGTSQEIYLGAQGGAKFITSNYGFGPSSVIARTSSLPTTTIYTWLGYFKLTAFPYATIKILSGEWFSFGSQFEGLLVDTAGNLDISGFNLSVPSAGAINLNTIYAVSIVRNGDFFELRLKPDGGSWSSLYSGSTSQIGRPVWIRIGFNDGLAAWEGGTWLSRFYTDELSGAEIDTELESLTPIRTADLWADWRFEPGVAIGTDSSGNGNDLDNNTSVFEWGYLDLPLVYGNTENYGIPSEEAFGTPTVMAGLAATFNASFFGTNM